MMEVNIPPDVGQDLLRYGDGILLGCVLMTSEQLDEMIVSMEGSHTYDGTHVSLCCCLREIVCNAEKRKLIEQCRYHLFPIVLHVEKVKTKNYQLSRFANLHTMGRINILQVRRDSYN